MLCQRGITRFGKETSMPCDTQTSALSDDECGREAIAIIAQWFGRTLPARPIRRDGRGMSLWQMCKGLRRLRLIPTAVRISFESLIHESMPCVAVLESHAPVESGHFVVILAIRPTELLVTDSTGKIWAMNHEQFKSCWTGIVVLVNAQKFNGPRRSRWLQPERESVPGRSR
jgi:ABC-type bacteriocin/lantibiotic exporter with double-glycine peptidase domain